MISKTNPCPLCEAHGYVEQWDNSILDALACTYQQWLDSRKLPQLSMDEHETSRMSQRDAETLSAFLLLWERLEEEARQ